MREDYLTTVSHSSLSALTTTYLELTQDLANQEALAGEQVLACLTLRDQLAHQLETEVSCNPAAVSQLTKGDQTLKTLAEPISNLDELERWRESLNPPESAWWWHLTPPVKKRILGAFERFDWIWDTLNLAILTIILALLVDITPRFYRGGADTTGAFAIVIQSVLTMLTAGGILTKTGAEVLERILRGLKIPPILWQEIRFSIALLVLFGIILFRNQGLPLLAQYYYTNGQAHHEAGRLLEAQYDYERALELNPNSSTSDIMVVHYSLGRLHEDLQNFAEARTAYQIAMQGNYIPAFNSLARLKILVDKKYDEAVFLLLNGLKLAGEQAAAIDEETSLTDLLYDADDAVELTDLIYNMQKNLGWARLSQERFREARAELELAIELKPDDAAAHCLLAQTIDALDAEKELPNSIEALEQWEQCSQLANRLNPDEDTWIYQAQLAQLRPDPATLTTTLVSAIETPAAEAIVLALNADLEIPELSPYYHLLLSANGPVKLKRDLWTDYYTTTVGTILRHGDQLLPAEDAQAIVLCADFTTWSVPGGSPPGLTMAVPIRNPRSLFTGEAPSLPPPLNSMSAAPI